MNRFAHPRGALRWLEWKRIEGNSHGLGPAFASLAFLACASPVPVLALGIAIAVLASTSWQRKGEGGVFNELLLVHGIRYDELVAARWRRDHLLVLGLSGAALALGLLDSGPSGARAKLISVAFGLPYYQLCVWVRLGAAGEAAARRRNLGVMLLWLPFWFFAAIVAPHIGDGMVIVGVAAAAACLALGMTVGLRSVIRRATSAAAGHDRSDATPRVRPARRWMRERRRGSASLLQSLIAADIRSLRHSGEAWSYFALAILGHLMIFSESEDPFPEVPGASFFLCIAGVAFVGKMWEPAKQSSGSSTEFLLSLPITRGMLHGARTLLVLAFLLVPLLLALVAELCSGVEVRLGHHFVADLLAVAPALFFSLVLHSPAMRYGAGEGRRKARYSPRCLGLLYMLLAGYLLGPVIWRDQVAAKLEQWGPTLAAHPIAVLSGTITVGLASWALSRARFRGLEIML